MFAPPVQKVPGRPPEQSLGAGLQRQDAWPSAPVQVSFAVQDVVALLKKQPWASCVHVARLPPVQNGPAVALLQSVGLHVQSFVPPASQVPCAPHAVVPLLKKQPLPSAWQSIDELPLHFGPAAAQSGSVLQPQTAAPADGVEQERCAPQETAVSA